MSWMGWMGWMGWMKIGEPSTMGLCWVPSGLGGGGDGDEAGAEDGDGSLTNSASLGLLLLLGIGEVGGESPLKGVGPGETADVPNGGKSSAGGEDGAGACCSLWGEDGCGKGHLMRGL